MVSHNSKRPGFSRKRPTGASTAERLVAGPQAVLELEESYGCGPVREQAGTGPYAQEP